MKQTGDDELNAHRTQLSVKSKTFLEDLRVYLFSSGKGADEIEEIVEELEVHLMEAEEKGKPIEKIIGQTPGKYMEQISNEMSSDYQSWFKYLSIIIFGGFSFTILDDLLEGSLSYSLLELIGYACIAVMFIFVILSVFKYISANKPSKGKQVIILYLVGLLPISLFVGLIFLDRFIETPVIHFGFTGTIVAASVTFLFLVGISWWAKTWALIIILALSTLPEYLLGLTTLQKSTQMIVSTLITFGGLAVYLLITYKMNRDS